MSQSKADIYISLITFFLSLYIFIESNNFGLLSAKFPKLLSISLFFLSLILLLSSIYGENSADTVVKKISVSLIVKIIIGIITYIMVVELVGYLPSSIILIFYITLVFGYKNKIKAIIFSFISAFIIYFVFVILLQVPAPEGLLGFL